MRTVTKIVTVLIFDIVSSTLNMVRTNMSKIIFRNFSVNCVIINLRFLLAFTTQC